MTRALAECIADGIAGMRSFDGEADYRHVLMSYHPPGGGQPSSKYFHEEPWLDFNMIQTTTRFRFFNYKQVLADYLKEPAKPVLDGEVAYEYSYSLNRRERERFPGRRISAWDVRRGAYWNVFSGGFGHTYGHRSFIGWVRTGEPSLRWGADKPWFEALDAEGATQMKWLRRLAESRPMEGRAPDQ